MSSSLSADLRPPLRRGRGAAPAAGKTVNTGPSARTRRSHAKGHPFHPRVATRRADFTERTQKPRNPSALGILGPFRRIRTRDRQAADLVALDQAGGYPGWLEPEGRRRMFDQIEGAGYRKHYMLAFGSIEDMRRGRDDLVQIAGRG
jgi:hypothetical protein